MQAGIPVIIYHSHATEHDFTIMYHKNIINLNERAVVVRTYNISCLINGIKATSSLSLDLKTIHKKNCVKSLTLNQLTLSTSHVYFQPNQLRNLIIISVKIIIADE
jgi:hypothetical protein